MLHQWDQYANFIYYSHIVLWGYVGLVVFLQEDPNQCFSNDRLGSYLHTCSTVFVCFCAGVVVRLHWPFEIMPFHIVIPIGIITGVFWAMLFNTAYETWRDLR